MKKYTICQRNRAAGSKVWYLRTFDTVSKKITFESLGTEKKGKAQELLDQKKAERFKTPAQLLQEKQPPIKKAVQAWLDTVSRGNPGTFEQYSSKIPHLLEFCEAHKIERLGDFTTQSATELISTLPAENKASTILNKKRIYNNFFNWAFATYGIEKINPFARVKTPKVKRTEKEFWTVEQLEKILDKFGRSVRASFIRSHGLCRVALFRGRGALLGKLGRRQTLDSGKRRQARKSPDR